MTARALAAGFILAVVATLASLAFGDWARTVRERRTMDRMRDIATALETVSRTQASYCAGLEEGPISMELLARHLSNAGQRDIPLRDGWGTEFIVELRPTSYSIRSLGADRRPGPISASPWPDATCSTGYDLIFDTGSFSRFGDAALICQ